jgi:hypothetical protein
MVLVCGVFVLYDLLSRQVTKRKGTGRDDKLDIKNNKFIVSFRFIY